MMENLGTLVAFSSALASKQSLSMMPSALLCTREEFEKLKLPLNLRMAQRPSSRTCKMK